MTPVLEWDRTGTRQMETGVSNVVLFPVSGSDYGTGVPWNGVTNITVKPEGAEASPLYADNIQYATLISAEKVKASIEAYTYPDQFGECDGSKALVTGVFVGQQPRKSFGLAWKTIVGNDTNPEAGYKIHILFGCMAAPSEKAHATINDSPEATTFSWEISTNPVDVPGAAFKPTAYLMFDSTKLEQSKMKKVLDKLWGSSTGTSTIVKPSDVSTLLA